jgi:hypothetical protein
MAEFRFWVEIEQMIGTQGVPVKHRTVDTTRFTAEKGGVAYPAATFDSNADGSYVMTYTGSGVYSILLDGLDQDELKNLELVDNDDLLTDDANLNPAPTTGYVEKDGSSYLRVKDHDKLILSTDIINNLTTGGTGDALSAQQGVVLKAAVDAISVPTINTDISTGDNSKVVGAQVLKNNLYQAYSSPTYISKFQYDNTKYRCP